MGECSYEKCIGDHLNQTNACTDNNYCCQAKTKQPITVRCSSVVSINLTRITSCGCHKCSTIKSTVRGVAKGGPGNTPFQLGYIYQGDKLLTRTGRQGDFSFDVSSKVTRLVVTFKDIGGYNNFYELTKVIPFAFGQETFVDVHMRLRPEPISVNASEGFEIPLGGNSASGNQQLPPVAAISMPPQSLMTEDGEPFNGTAKVTVNFMDPRNETEVREADGDFTALSEDGEEELLETFGMMKIDFQDSKGAKLEPNSDIDILLDPEEFNLTREEAEAVKLWYMDEKTGRWRVIDSGLKTHESRRSKRSQRLFYFGKISRDKHFKLINLDAVTVSCFIKIEARDGESKSGQSGVITVLVSENNYRYLEYYIRINTSKCIETFCTETQAIIQVTLNGKYLIPYQRNINNAVIQDHGIKFHQNKTSSGRFSNRITMKKLSKPKTSTPPFYTDMESCAKDKSGNSFYFEAFNSRAPFEDLLQIFLRETDPDYWYPDPNTASLCFVKIGVMNIFNCPGGTAYFHVESFVNSKKSAGYNIVSVAASNGAACAEYKCPSRSDKLKVKITSLTRGKFSTGNPATEQFKSKTNAIINNNHVDFNPQYRLTDPKIGLFHTIEKDITEKNTVKDDCLEKSVEAAIVLKCT